MTPPSRESEDPADAREVEPGTITRIAPRRRERGRFAVEIDGRAGLTLSEDLLLRSGLQVGDVIDSAMLDELTAHDEVARATDAALHFLAYRPRTEREVRDRLRRGGYRAEAIEQVVARLHEWRYLDDADFARRWVEGRSSQRPRGKRLLERELRQKGIAAEMAREVIDEADLDEAPAAEALVRRRLPAYAGEDPVTARRRLTGYLMRRGYGYDVVRVALDRAMGAPDEEIDDSPAEDE